MRSWFWIHENGEPTDAYDREYLSEKLFDTLKETGSLGSGRFIVEVVKIHNPFSGDGYHYDAYDICLHGPEKGYYNRYWGGGTPDWVQTGDVPKNLTAFLIFRSLKYRVGSFVSGVRSRIVKFVDRWTPPEDYELIV